MLMVSSTIGNQKSDTNIFMPELVQEDKKMTYQTRLNTLEKDIQLINLLRTMEVDLISKEKDFLNFWNKSCLEMSKKLLSLTKTDYADLDLNSWRELQSSTIAKSWFWEKHNSPLKKNLFKTLFPSSMYSHVGFMDSENTLVRSKKIRIYPNKSDKLKYKQYLGLSRYWYNQAINYLKQEGTKASIYEVRKIQKNNHPEWAFNCPQRIREHAMLEACKAVKNAKLKFKQFKQFQEVHYRRKKDVKQRFGFDKQSLKSSNVFRGKYKLNFISTEEFEVDKENTKIVCENGRWFVVVPTTIRIKKPENQRLGTVALDPGVRTFQTYFSAFSYGKIGNGDFNKIYRLCIGLDKIYSKMSKADYNAKRRLKKASMRLRWKIKDLIDDLHKKTAHFLVTNFDNILIPSFKTSKMVNKLRSKTVRNMLSFAHYRFKTFLKIKAEEYSCKVFEVNESYTSRVCSYCGKEHNIGSKKILKCEKELDRDLNGARNIYLKYMSRALGASPLLSN